jgi:exodeoxyribonuclease V alpha subunit
MPAAATPNAAELHRLTGIVLELHPKSNENWSRAKIEKADGTVCWVTAQFGLEVGETVDAHCTFNEKFRSFDVVSLADTDGKVTNEVVTLRLVQELSGVGAVKARRLSDRFPDLYETITKDPQQIATACGVDLDEVSRVASILSDEGGLLSRVSKLITYGYPGHIAKKIAKKDAAWKVALESPYRCIRLIDGLGWLIADEVGRKAKIPLDSEDRIVAGIDHYYRDKVHGDGHTKVHAAALLDSGALPNLLGLPRAKIQGHLDVTLINLNNGYYTNAHHRKNAATIAGFFGV